MARSDEYIIEVQIKGGTFVPAGASHQEQAAILRAQQMEQSNPSVTGARVKQRASRQFSCCECCHDLFLWFVCPLLFITLCGKARKTGTLPHNLLNFQ